jgi:hypothetical protein
MIMGAAATTSNLASPTAIPESCDNPEAAVDVAVPGICNFAQNKANCCPNGLVGDLDILPDIRNCSTTCQSYYISWFCYFSCSGNLANDVNSRTCNAPLRTLFEACQSCNILNRGRRVDNTTDYNAFLSVNNILTVSQSGQPCDDFTSWGRRCEETQTPTVQSVDVTDDQGVSITSLDSTDLGPALESGKNITNTNGVVYGKGLKVCTRVRNVRPDGCTVLRAGLGLYPVSVRILVEARGIQNVSYVMADAIFQSDALVQEGTDIYRACINDLMVTPLLQGSYEITIAVSAVNTFGTASSNNLDASENQLVIPVTNTSPFGEDFTLGEIADNEAAVLVCNIPSDANFTDLGDHVIFTGTPNWAVPTANADFNVHNVVCCENVHDEDQYAAQCTLSGVGITHALNVVNFLANEQDTTISLLHLRVAGGFIARGSITLVNARVEMENEFEGIASLVGTKPTFAVTANTALRGAAGNVVVIAGGALLSISNSFLILLDHIEVVAHANSQIELDNNARLVVAEMAMLTTSKSNTTLNGNSKIVQYTQSPGRIRFGGVGTNDDDSEDKSTTAKTLISAQDAGSAIVVVSGTFQAFNQPLVAPNADIVAFDVEVRISTVRGPNVGGASTDEDANVVPIDTDIPSQVQPLTPHQTKKGFTVAANRASAQIMTPVPTTATINACGTRHTDITIPAFGRLLVAPVGVATNPCATTFNGVTYSLVTDELTVAANGIIEVVGVAGGYYPIRVNTAAGFHVSSASTLRLTLGTGVQTSRIDILPIFSIGNGATTTCSANLPRLVVTNPGNRVIDLNCDATNGIFLSLSEVQTPTLPQINPALFVSNSEYCIIVNQQLDTWTRTDFLNAVVGSFSGTPANYISITGFALDQTRNNQIRISFRCLDLTSVPGADQRCQSITTAAETSGSSFRNTILATSTCSPTTIVGANDNDDSNHGLYGLFGLIAIPLLCICLICLLVRNSRRRADNQYMQDAATFSNVASGPQPIAAALPAPQYDLGKAYPYPTGPVVAVPQY